MGRSLTPVTKRIPVICPDCGSHMVLRLPKRWQDFEPFYGCRDWPDCKGTRPAVFDIFERRYKEIERYDPDWGWPGEL